MSLDGRLFPSQILASLEFFTQPGRLYHGSCVKGQREVDL